MVHSSDLLKLRLPIDQLLDLCFSSRVLSPAHSPTTADVISSLSVAANSCHRLPLLFHHRGFHSVSMSKTISKIIGCPTAVSALNLCSRRVRRFPILLARFQSRRWLIRLSIVPAICSASSDSRIVRLVRVLLPSILPWDRITPGIPFHRWSLSCMRSSLFSR